MLKVLVVSPHFPPTNSADMHRVRMVLPHLRECKVIAEVLAVSPEMVASPKDEWMQDGLPKDVPVHRVRALSLKWRRVPGFGTLTNRARGALRRCGDRLLRSGRFDLIYFSTTQFGLHTLGPRWKSKFGVPFVMDYQDPWFTDYYSVNPDLSPPGGRLKYTISHWLAKLAEPRVLQQCSGITSVSSAYPEQLLKRYSFLSRKFPVCIAPFPFDESDLKRAYASNDTRRLFARSEKDLQNWVYVGVCGQVMHHSLRSLFAAIALLRKQAANSNQLMNRTRLHFLGTSYAPAGTGVQSVMPLAREYDLQDIVVESTDRIPYSVAMQYLNEADALIVPGSNDSGYIASKIFPYLFARKPMLAVFHEQSPVTSLIKSCGGACLVSFSTDETVDETGAKIKRLWLDAAQYKDATHLDTAPLESFSAKAQAKLLTDFFLSICSAPLR